MTHDETLSVPPSGTGMDGSGMGGPDPAVEGVETGYDLVQTNLERGRRAAQRRTGVTGVTGGQADADGTTHSDRLARQLGEDVQRLAEAVGRLCESAARAAFRLVESAGHGPDGASDAAPRPTDAEPRGSSVAPPPRTRAGVRFDPEKIVIEGLSRTFGTLVAGLKAVRRNGPGDTASTASGAPGSAAAPRQRGHTSGPPPATPEVTLEPRGEGALGSFEVRNRGGMLGRLEMECDGLIGPGGHVIPAKAIDFEPRTIEVPPRQVVTVTVSARLEPDTPGGAYVGEIRALGDGLALRRPLRLVLERAT